MRFIDDHCVDSEEIRAEMQRDIDQLVVELEDQCRQNRTAESLMEQVNRLEIDLASAHEVFINYFHKPIFMFNYSNLFQFTNY